VAEPGDRVRRLFDPLLRNLPADVRYRLFKPAYEDLRADHLLRLRGLRRLPGARAVCSALFAARVLGLIAACYRSTPGFFADNPISTMLAGLGRAASSSRHMLMNDLRHALRLLWKGPAFSAAAIAALALGIGSATVIFAVVDAVLLRPLPFPGADRLVAIDETQEGRLSSVSPVNFYDWQRQARSFETMAIYTDLSMTLASGDRPVVVNGFVASSEFFPALGLAPALGRWLSPEDDRAGGTPSVVLGHQLWRRAFAGRTDVIGEQAVLDGMPHTIVGVAPRGAGFPEGAEAWFSLALTERSLSPAARGAHWVNAIARLRPGVTVESAQAELDAIAAGLATAYPRTNRDAGVRITGLLESLVGPSRPALLLLLAGVTCLLLIACVNVSGLLMARAVGRRTESLVRASLGAGRLALGRQVLAESLMLAAAAGVVASLLAAWGLGLLEALLPTDLPRASTIAFDARAALFVFAVALVAGIALGLVPAWQASRAALGGTLQASRSDAGASGSVRLRGLLTMAEVALAMVLLVGAGVTATSFALLGRVSPGFDPRGALTFWLSLPEGVYREPAQIGTFYRELEARLSALPGVVSAGAVMIPPVARTGFGGTFTVDGRPEDPADEPRAQLRPATPGYFKALGLQVTAGRAIDERDHESAPAVAVVSRTAAQRYWPGQNPIGRTLRMHVSAAAGREPVREIVGVVQDVKTGRLQQPPAPVVYVPHAQHLASVMTLVVRTSGDPLASAGAVLGALAQLDRAVVAQELLTLDAHVARARTDQRFRATLLAGFAGTAFLLAIVGLYAVVAYTTGRRRHEIGVRMALGATRHDIVRQVVREGMLPVLAGLVAGGVAAYLLSSLLGNLLFGVRPFEPAVVASMAAALAGAAWLACYLPARRSGRIDPRDALRAD
jgi:predicted permease